VASSSAGRSISLESGADKDFAGGPVFLKWVTGGASGDAPLELPKVLEDIILLMSREFFWLSFREADLPRPIGRRQIGHHTG